MNFRRSRIVFFQFLQETEKEQREEILLILLAVPFYRGEVITKSEAFKRRLACRAVALAKGGKSCLPCHSPILLRDDGWSQRISNKIRIHSFENMKL